MSKNPQVDQIRQMKRELQEHYDRFKTLRSEGDNEAALQQFNVTLKVASDLMELSTQALKEVAGAGPRINPADMQAVGEMKEGKVLHFPVSNQTH
jgi:hypothetical protein